jgi:hypothetical protein
MALLHYIGYIINFPRSHARVCTRPREAVVAVTAEPLPTLLDCKALQAELGVTRAAAEAVMRLVPSVVVPGLRKSYCRRSDVLALLEACTFEKDEVPV